MLYKIIPNEKTTVPENPIVPRPNNLEETQSEYTSDEGLLNEDPTENPNFDVNNHKKHSKSKATTKPVEAAEKPMV